MEIGGHLLASASRPALPRTFPRQKYRNAALRIRFHFSLCFNCSAVLFMPVENAITLFKLPAMFGASA